MRSFDWAVGLFEGEGWISILPNKTPGHRTRVRIGAKSTDHDVIRAVRRIFGVGVVQGPYRGVNKSSLTWSCGAHDEIEPLLKRMLPLLSGRRRAKAKEAIAVIESNRARFERR